MDPQFTELVDEIEKRFDNQLNSRLAEFKTGIEERMQMHFESMEDLVKATADGYAMNLDRIERKVDELNAKFDTKFDDHDRILANHNERITTLENRP